MTPTGRKWLRLDALNRSWRTTLQGIAVVIFLPALDVGIQLVQRFLLSGQPIDWIEVRNRMITEAITAIGMVIAAYIHRMKIDPSRIPSALPPATPAVDTRLGP